jgi:hypothetical protein
MSGFDSGDLSVGPPCYHCDHLNRKVKLAYEGSSSDRCIWVGSYCRPDVEGGQFEICDIGRVLASLIRTGSAGSYSYKLRVALQSVNLVATIIDEVVWEYDYGNLGSALPDCIDEFELECALISNSLDCEDPNAAIVRPFRGQCEGVYSTATLFPDNVCVGCSVPDYPLPWYANPAIYEQRSSVRFLDVQITGVSSVECPADCTEICDACDEICGAEPGCTDEFGCDCVSICDAVGWEHPDCVSCWEVCDPTTHPTCYNQHLAYQTCIAGAEYIACIEECDECEACIECPECDEPINFRMIGGPPTFLGLCVWTRLCGASDELCAAFDGTPVELRLQPDGDNGLYAELRLNDSVRWTHDVCSDCYFGSSHADNNFDCLNWVAMADGWTLEVLNEDAEACVWDTATVRVTPELPVAMTCFRRPNICPLCEGPESRWTQYLLITIPGGHWDATDCGADDRCDLVTGEFLLEAYSAGCCYRYQFPAGEGPGCEVPDPGDYAHCCATLLRACIQQGDGEVVVRIELRMNRTFNAVDPDECACVLVWELPIPYLYGAEGIPVIDCSAIDGDATFVYQNCDESCVGISPFCEWLNGAAIHVQAVAA